MAPSSIDQCIIGNTEVQNENDTKFLAIMSRSGIMAPALGPELVAA